MPPARPSRYQGAVGVVVDVLGISHVLEKVANEA
jgi:ribosomal protein L21E